MNLSGPAVTVDERLRLAFCAALVLLGLSAILGWLLEIEALKSVAPGLSTMKFNAAAGFVLTGLGLAAAPHGRARFVAGLTAVPLILIGAITLAEYAFELSIDIDQLFVVDDGVLTGSGHPGRMSPLTAGSWIVLGTAILMLAFGHTRTAIVAAHALASIAGLAAIVAAAGYAFGAAPYGWIGFYAFVAVHTAVGLLIAAAATLMTRASEGWFQPYADSPAAREVLVRLLPLSVILPVVTGLLILLGGGLGAYNAAYALALFIPVIAALLVAVTLWVAARLRESEAIRQRHERHLELLVAELNHRVKNTLSIVQSFAHQSFKGAPAAAPGVHAFEGRLSALAQAHNLLTDQNWDEVDIHQITRTCLAASDGAQRFHLDGQQRPVSPKTAVTLAMTLHELATNSIKYGALSVPKGSVSLRWWDEDEKFHFTWRDQGGPMVLPPSRRGFGTRMLERALAGELEGKARLDFAPDGLVYELVAPARNTL